MKIEVIYSLKQMDFYKSFIIFIFFTACIPLQPANQSRLNVLLGAASESPTPTVTPSPTSTPTASPTPTATPTPTTLISDGIQGNAYHYTSCLNFSTVTSTSPLPGSGGGSEVEFIVADYSRLSALDGVFSIQECANAGVNRTKIDEFSWEVSAVTAARFRSMTLSWTGLEGQYFGACDGVASPTSLFSVDPMQVFDGVNWNNLGVSPLNTLSTVSQEFTSPQNYVVSGKIWMRLTTAAGSGSCATIHTDFVSLTLNP